MDLMPTIFDLLGVDLGSSVAGQSLRPYLSDQPADEVSRDNLYLEFHGLRDLHTQRALVTRTGFKYIFNPADEDEVYNLNNDPGELHNLIQSEPHQTLVQDLRQQMIAAAARTGDPVRDYISKLFGHWEALSGQPDVSSPKLAVTGVNKCI
jgi:arylsulfatase A-like enzyme